MLNKDIPKRSLEKIKMIVFDSDGVSIPRGTEIKESVSRESIEMNFKTSFITDEFARNIKKLQREYLVVISSGRSLLYLQSMYEKALGKKVIIQAENGSLSLIGAQIQQHIEIGEDYFEMISDIKGKIRTLPIKGVEPKQFILSVHAEKELSEVYEIVQEYDENNILKVMWNGEAFDIQPKELSKAYGLNKLMSHFSLKKETVLAMGDRINDVEMLEMAGIGVSADQKAVQADYHTTGEGLPGEILAKYLVEKLNL